MIYHLQNKNQSSLLLWKEDDHVYRVLKMGDFSPLIIGNNFTLIHKTLISPFEIFLNDQVELHSSKIKRTKTGEIWTDYFQLDIKGNINPENYQTLDKTGINIWQYEHHVFITEEFKTMLSKVAKEKLVFNKGFSHFGGLA